ncbi:MarR family winged helix-turn-helix transcriptional regulator [Acidithrix sp. C25]|uniref:MarR family winged helix-turn-helix transcriptional regulator n=1 Tax=Acidithrix sp. C25 TaxID=1671482 RepID=UPI00191BBFA3|nr:MarR family winged helix-turn-helix transcriptional regulator [Acidithrix sp. C25]CAG4934850.1 unnamed protein product [Acidithrix sp. C25]
MENENNEPATSDFGISDLDFALSRLGRSLRKIKIPSSFLNRDIDMNTFWQLSPLRSGVPLRPSEIANAIGLDSSTVSRALQKLEAQGLIERRIDPSDARAHLIALSAEGATVLEIVGNARREKIATVLSHWDKEEISTLLFYLTRLIEELENDA